MPRVKLVFAPACFAVVVELLDRTWMEAYRASMARTAAEHFARIMVSNSILSIEPDSEHKTMKIVSEVGQHLGGRPVSARLHPSRPCRRDVVPVPPRPEGRPGGEAAVSWGCDDDNDPDDDDHLFGEEFQVEPEPVPRRPGACSHPQATRSTHRPRPFCRLTVNRTLQRQQTKVPPTSRTSTTDQYARGQNKETSVVTTACLSYAVALVKESFQWRSTGRRKIGIKTRRQNIQGHVALLKKNLERKGPSRVKVCTSRAQSASPQKKCTSKVQKNSWLTPEHQRTC